MEEMKFAGDGRSRPAGMGDFRLVSPDGEHVVEIRYEGEPPHGDSYHRTTIDGRAFPGHAWGCQFAFSPCSRYVAFSWMPRRFDRRTVVADMREVRYAVPPEYIYDFSFTWPTLTGDGKLSAGQAFVFDGSESWEPY